jgi:hypothetical protein
MDRTNHRHSKAASRVLASRVPVSLEQPASQQRQVAPRARTLRDRRLQTDQRDPRHCLRLSPQEPVLKGRGRQMDQRGHRHYSMPASAQLPGVLPRAWPLALVSAGWGQQTDQRDHRHYSMLASPQVPA